MNYRFKWTRSVIVGAIVLACMAIPALSLTVQMATLEELTTEATIVVRGSIDAVNYTWGNEEQRVIHTLVDVNVSEYIKGDGTSKLQFKQLGGQMGELQMHVTGTPAFDHGDEVILFLIEHDGAYWIHSIVLGNFSIVDGPQGTMVLNNVGNVHVLSAETGKEMKPADYVTHMPLTEFVSEVKSYVR